MYPGMNERMKSRSRTGCLLPAVLMGLCCTFSAAAEKETLGVQDIHRLTGQLSSEDWILQVEALELLGRHGIKTAKPGIEKLLEQGKTPWAKGRALVALARISGPSVYATVEHFSRDKDAVLRRAAVEALDLMGTPRAAAAAQKLLSDEDLAVRAEVAYVCAKHDPQAAWPVIQALTDDPDPRLAAPLARALACMGTGEALVRLEKLYDTVSGKKEKAYQVIEGLHLADEAAIPLLIRLVARHRPDPRVDALGRRILKAFDPEKVASNLQAVFASGKTDLYETAAFFAATVFPSQALEDAIAVAMRKTTALSPESLSACLEALVAIDPGRHAALFTDYLEHESSAVRMKAVRCRSLCDRKDLFEVFRPRIVDPAKPVALAALDSLVRVPLDRAPREGLAEYLKAPLRSPDRRIVLAAFNLLGNRGKPEEFDTAMDWIRPYLEGSDEEYRRWAAEALAELGGHERLGSIAAAQGYIADWKILGPFLNDRENTGFRTEYEPEKEIDLDRSYEVELVWDLSGGKRNKNTESELVDIVWRDARVTRENGRFNVAAMMPPPAYYVLAYGVSDIHSPSNQTVQAFIQADNSFRLWVNGEMVSELDDVSVKRSSQAEVPVIAVKIPLRSGRNRFMIKVANRGGPWWFRVRLLHEQGKVFGAGP